MICEGLCGSGGTIGSIDWEGPVVWTDRQQKVFEALKACLISAPILGFPTEQGRFLLDTDTSLFAVGGLEPAPGRSRGGDCVCQPQSPLIPAVLLYHPPSDVGHGRNVYSFPVIFVRCSVYSSHRPQLPPMAA